MEERLKELITAGSEERVNELLKFCDSVKVIKIQTDDQYVHVPASLPASGGLDIGQAKLCRFKSVPDVRFQAISDIVFFIK